MQKVSIKISQIITLILIGILSNIYAQESGLAPIGDVATIIQHFESGIKTGAVKNFSDDLSSETYISLETGISSHFSANQSFYILKEYLQNYKPISFRVIRKDISNSKPYLIGTLVYSKEGVRGESQVFVSLNVENNSWKIYQITIN